MSTNLKRVFFIAIFASSSRLSQVCCLLTRTKSPCDALSSDSPGVDCNNLPKKETWVDTVCPSYQYSKHGTCSDIIGNGRIYMKKASQVSAERKLNVTFQQLLPLISWLQDWSLNDVLQFADVTHKTLIPRQKQAVKYFLENPEKMTICSEKARKTFCLYRFPTCITYKSNSVVSVREELLCHEACLKLKQEICAEAFILLSIFDKDVVQMYTLDCNVLPKKNSDKCIYPAFLIADSDPTVHTRASSSATSLKISSSKNEGTAKSTAIPTTKIGSTATSTTKTISTATGPLVHTTARSSAKSSKTSTSKYESTTKSTTTENPSSATSTKKSISTTNATFQTTDKKTTQANPSKKTRSSTSLYYSTTSPFSVTTLRTKNQQQNNTVYSTSNRKEPSAFHAKQNWKESISKNWLLYGLCSGAVLILCLALIGILYIRKRSRRTKSQNEGVEEEEPYHICPFDNAEEIGQLMRSAQEELSHTESLEMRAPPPIPNSARPYIENISLLVEP